MAGRRGRCAPLGAGGREAADARGQRALRIGVDTAARVGAAARRAAATDADGHALQGAGMEGAPDPEARLDKLARALGLQAERAERGTDVLTKSKSAGRERVCAPRPRPLRAPGAGAAALGKSTPEDPSGACRRRWDAEMLGRWGVGALRRCAARQVSEVLARHALARFDRDYFHTTGRTLDEEVTCLPPPPPLPFPLPLALLYARCSPPPSPTFPPTARPTVCPLLPPPSPTFPPTARPTVCPLLPPPLPYLSPYRSPYCMPVAPPPLPYLSPYRSPYCMPVAPRRAPSPLPPLP